MRDRIIGDAIFAVQFVVSFYLVTLILQTIGDMLP